jgi:cysteinyl-tRNA synthetase
MALRIFNTLAGRKEVFKPTREGKVGLYVCGITAYDVCHVGHARSAVVFDVMARYLRYLGYDLTFVKNFTDVEDKIINKAKAEHTDIFEISDRYIKAHDEDMAALGIAKPTVTPRATEHIDGMIELIEKLLAKGLAYVVDGDVVFCVERFKDYGKLSGRSLEDMLAGARVDVNEKKQNPLDFALWKASKEGEPWWESPWGHGRPGWHIECSVMSQKFLGETFDIHGGGEDLIFPHHENEIAQSEGATGKPMAHYWLHNGFVKINNEKMSKSLGNVCTISEMLKNYHAEVIRLFMLQSHYRSPVDFSDKSLSEARTGMGRFYTTLKAMKDFLVSCEAHAEITADMLSEKHRNVFEQLEALPVKFVEAMDDDFNTARGIGHIFDGVRLINAYMAESRCFPKAETCFVLRFSWKKIRELGMVLGLFMEDPDVYFKQDNDREARKRGINIAEIEHLIKQRREARWAKDWGRADEIRQRLAEKGVVLKDTPTETTWKIV